MSGLNVYLLPMLRSATKQNDQGIAVFAEVDSVTRAKVHPQLEKPQTNAFGGGKISGFQSKYSSGDPRSHSGVKSRSPFAEWRMTGRSDEFA